MRADLCVRAEQLGEMRADVHVREHVLAMDYPSKDGGMATPLEVLLASLAGCAANTLALVLRRKMGIAVDGLEVEARGERRAEHPTLLTEIELRYRVRAAALDEASLGAAMKTAEGVLCPVLAMLRPGTKITSVGHVEASSMACA